MLIGDNKYYCEKCGVQFLSVARPIFVRFACLQKKQDTMKRCCIKDLPRNLILHLKRFEFDLDTMRKVKINDYCSFPFSIDVKAFTKEGLEPSAPSSESSSSSAMQTDASEDSKRPASYYQ